MAFKLSGGIFFKLPFRNSANAAHAFKPFVSQPAGGPAVSGIVDDKCFIAVGDNLRLISHFLYGLDAMQDPFS